MALFTKTAVAERVTLVDALAAKQEEFEDTSFRATEQATLLAEQIIRLRSDAEVAQKHSKAVSDALDILDKAGVVI